MRCPIHVKNIQVSCGSNLGGIKKAYFSNFDIVKTFTFEYDIIDTKTSEEYSTLSEIEKLKYVEEDEMYVKYALDVDGNKIISAITDVELYEDAEPMQEFQFRNQTGSLVTEIEANDNGTSFYNITANLVFAKIDAHKRLAIQSLAMNELCGVIQDSNGNMYFIGYDNGLRTTTATADTGTAYSDMNGYTVALTTASLYMPIPITTEALSKLLAK